VGQHVREDRVATFVVGDSCLLEIREHEAVARLTHEDPVSCGIEVTHLDKLASTPHCVQRGLVDEIGQVGPGHSRSAAGDDRQVQVGPIRLSLQ